MRGQDGYVVGDLVELTNGTRLTIDATAIVAMKTYFEGRVPLSGKRVEFTPADIDHVVNPASTVTEYTCPECGLSMLVFKDTVDTYHMHGMCPKCLNTKERREYMGTFDKSGRIPSRKPLRTQASVHPASQSVPVLKAGSAVTTDVQTTACFTGHRPDKLGGYDASADKNRWVKYELTKMIESLIEKGYTTFISGMALGVDMWAAEIVLEKRDMLAPYVDIKLIAAIPFEGQEKKWPPASQNKYQEILTQADEVAVVSPGGYERSKMQVRNIWMVDHSSAVVAVWDGSPGGTHNCVIYAGTANHKPTVYRIQPNDYDDSWDLPF